MEEFSMRKYLLAFLVVMLPLTANIALAGDDDGEKAPKEWTFLIFLNGNNDLDRFGAMDINELEKFGSDKNINVVVQWASLANKDTRRLLVRQDNNPKKVTSPTVQKMPAVDMGDWRKLVEFVEWGVKNYPAKKYFVDIWNHGRGWYLKSNQHGPTRDISFDDNTGNAITTLQLGQAMEEIAKLIGHKLDIYGSDACLMGMAEIAEEMADNVEVFIGSEELEPGEGWPYDGLMKRWVVNPSASAAEVSKYLVEEYFASYSGGTQGTQSVTLSAYDLSKMDVFKKALSDFSGKILKLEAPDRQKIMDSFRSAQMFTFDDYRDVIDFLNIAEKAGIYGLKAPDFSSVRDAAQDMIIINKASDDYSRAFGLAMWMPSSASDYGANLEKYTQLKFDRATRWGDALKFLLQ
ncbi:MAG: hypothetical protein A2583_07520 [Bdellovibrionales bacterium RIFOXYD1_FULL_53_11]|nr:MAG: hypothetical protein A2583_07520 [Bdellovibrionales bacterium RIFOXYD1_FULL_53_11]